MAQEDIKISCEGSEGVIMALDAAEKVKIRNVIADRFMNRGSCGHKTLQEIMEHISSLSDEDARTLISNWEALVAAKAAAAASEAGLGI